MTDQIDMRRFTIRYVLFAVFIFGPMSLLMLLAATAPADVYQTSPTVTVINTGWMISILVMIVLTVMLAGRAYDLRTQRQSRRVWPR